MCRTKNKTPPMRQMNKPFKKSFDGKVETVKMTDQEFHKIVELIYDTKS